MPRIVVTTLIRHNADKSLGNKRNQDEWAAIHSLHIVKGEPVHPRGFFYWRYFDGTKRKADGASAELFIGDLCRHFAARITGEVGAGVQIVPVPNGSATIGNDNSFRTLDLARRIANASGTALTAFDTLRWHQTMGRTHLGERRRDVDDHIRALRVKPGGDHRVVLFDDVVTSGSQLFAAKTKLEEAGYEVARMYAIADVLDEGQRGSAPAWKTVTKNLSRMADFFADLNTDF